MSNKPTLSAVRATPPPSFAAVPLAGVMTLEVVCVKADMSIEALTSLLVERNISGVPVVDDAGKPVGMISKTDLVRHQHEEGGCGEAPSTPLGEELQTGFHELPSGATVGDYMLPIAFTLGESAPLAHAAALMAWEGVHRIPVCSPEGDVVGIVTTLDVVRWVADMAGYPARK
jgi:CBS domain-containing protein